MLAVNLLFIRLVCAVIFAFKKVFFRHLVIISQFRVTFCDFRKDCSWRGMTPLSSCSASLIHINQPPSTHFLYPLSPGSRGQQGATLDESSVHCRATQRKMNINFIWSLILGKFQLQSVFSLPEQLSGVSGFISPLFFTGKSSALCSTNQRNFSFFQSLKQTFPRSCSYLCYSSRPPPGGLLERSHRDFTFYQRHSVGKAFHFFGVMKMLEGSSR